MRTKKEALAAANGCPGCAQRADLPPIHLCMINRERFPHTVLPEQSAALTEILPFLQSSTIPWVQGELILQANLERQRKEIPHAARRG